MNKNLLKKMLWIAVAITVAAAAAFSLPMIASPYLGMLLLLLMMGNPLTTAAAAAAVIIAFIWTAYVIISRIYLIFKRKTATIRG